MTSDAPDNPSTPDVDFTRQLPAEVARWEADGIITAEQAEAIRNRYASDSPEAGGSAIGNRVVTVIAIMGAALIGLGIIAFIAANWSEIPKLAKLALMVVGTPAIYVIGWFIGYRFGYVRIGVAVILLGAIAFGASIHLVAQTYHVPVNHPNLVPLWFLGVIPLAYITRSQAVFALSIILFLAAAGFRAQEWVPELNSEDTILLLPGLLPLGAFLFAAGRMQARFPDTRQFARLCDISGLLVAAAGIYFLSFDELWWDIGRSKLSFNALTVEYWGMVAIAVIVIAALFAVAAWRDAGQRTGQIWWEAGAVGSMALVAAVMWLGLAFGGAWLWWVFNLVMLAGVLAMIAAGYRWNRAYLINLAVPIFAITLFTRYFEFGLGLLGQSVAFIVAGVILLAGGFGMEYLRRRLVRRIRESEAAS
ncbi:MAG: DUF2157 domain-containing protein [Chloroflexota bacterium]|nr:DUF2157 domain-containing protein [Chloroflexota bacterium]MDE2682543.1 DUF2157 domain-containing protein [Chloroflexota bacterium]